MFTFNRLVASLFITALAPTSVFASPDGEIREVRLSSGGLAEILRASPVGKDGAIQLRVPLDQVDDILKSLMLNSATASIAGISLVGPQPLKERFRGLPFSPDALSSVPSLLTALQGVEVTVTSNGKTVQGNVLGVEPRNGRDGQEMFLVSMLASAGAISTLELAQDASVTIEDELLRNQLIDASQAMARAKNDRSRLVRVLVNGAADSTVNVSYVVAAPIWKAAYKIVVHPDGKARLQAWTVLENASGEDWKNVKIVLTSADPVTLRQRLHQMYWRQRHEVPVNTAAADVPEADTGNLANRSASRMAMGGARAVRKSMMVPAPAPAPMMAEQAEVYGGAGMADADRAEASESDISATFALSGTYDVSNGDTLSVPVVDTEVPASMVSMYRQGASTPHPVAALMLSNTTDVSLPVGILTIYDAETGYVGDAQLAGLPNGDQRLASFAIDRKVTITEEQQPLDEIVEVKVVDGMLRLTHKNRIVTRYTVSGALDGERTVVIEHPVRSGWTFSSPASDGKTVSHHRLKAVVAAGEETTVQAVDEQLQHAAYAVTDSVPDALLGWSASAPDQALAAKLVALAEVRQKQIDATTGLQQLDQARERLANEQSRIRQNLGAVPANSDMSTRYLKQLESTENAIRDLNGKREALESEAQRLDGDVKQVLRTF